MTDERQQIEHPTSGWEEWSHYVLKTLERFDVRLDYLADRQQNIQNELVVLKTKFALYALGAGFLTAVVIEFVKHFLKGT